MMASFGVLVFFALSSLLLGSADGRVVPTTMSMILCGDSFTDAILAACVLPETGERNKRGQ